MVATFLPQLAPRLAYLMAPVYLRNETADAAFPTADFFSGKPFVSEWFAGEKAALTWLNT